MARRPKVSAAQNADIRTALITAGVKNLREFGYPTVSDDNILTDPIYSQFFDSMLSQNMGGRADDAIVALRAEISSHAKAAKTDPSPVRR